MLFHYLTSSPIGVNRSTCCLAVSCCFLLLGVTLYAGLDYIVATLIYSKLTLLSSDSELYDKWVRLPIPLSLKVWIFEETNPDEIWSGKKPVLREKGPYVFSLWREKKVLETNEGRKTIKYAEHNLYFFNESESVGSLQDKIFTLNVPTVAIADQLGSISDNLPLKGLTGVPLELIGNGLFQAHKEELMTKMTVDELLFKGQKVKILQTLATIWTPLSLVGIKFPSTGLKDNTYGLFYGQNSTFGEPFEIIGQGSELGKIVTWKNERKLNIWPGDRCNQIRGTDGTLFSPYVDKDQALYVFIPDLCRFVSFNYDRDVIFRGINGYRYILSDSTFINKYRYPYNDCFCPSTGFPCNTDGVTSLGPCRSSAPIYFSRPHFLSASADFRDSIEGLKPNDSAHRSFIDVEPTTGTPMRAKIQLQINVYVRRFPFIKTMSDIRKETLYPLAWFEQSAEINEQLARELANKLIKPLSYVTIVKYGSLTAAIIIFTLCLAWKLFALKKGRTLRKRKEPSLEGGEPIRPKGDSLRQNIKHYHPQKRQKSESCSSGLRFREARPYYGRGRKSASLPPRTRNISSISSLDPFKSDRRNLT